jgi:tyrosyl-tRNA synthetase
MHEKQEIINRLKKNLAEVITGEEFEQRITSGQSLTHYIGFEISGYVHIGQGIMSALVIKDLQELGVKCTIWLADWHSAINNKLDGSKETAAEIGKGYFTEAIKACLLAVGADAEQVEFRLASEWYAKDPMKYWDTVVVVGKNTTMARLQRSISIMGRQAGDNVEAATLFYPLMQVADIFYQNIDIVHAGMDQRKAHVIMRDKAKKIEPNRLKPVVLHQPLLPGLLAPEIPEAGEEMAEKAKMSKSKPDSAIWIHDSETDIVNKIAGAYCPMGPALIAHNPILNWTKNILFWNRTKPFVIKREEKHGGNIEFSSYEDLENAFAAGQVHPMDLKATVAQEISELLAPAREHFANQEVAAKKEELDKVLKNR